MDFAKHNITNAGQLMNFMQDKMQYGFTCGEKVDTELLANNHCRQEEAALTR